MNIQNLDKASVRENSIQQGISTTTPSNQLSVKEIIHKADQRMCEQKK